jgi:serine/threonine protein kinase
MLLARPYGLEVDWWSYGIVACQLLFRRSPFGGDDEDEIYDDIIGSGPHYPANADPISQSLIQNLLEKDPKARLGSGATGVTDVKRHVFFKDIDWDGVYHKRFQPPCQPLLKDVSDVSNFDSDYTGENNDPFASRNGGKYDRGNNINPEKMQLLMNRSRTDTEGA